MNEEITSATTSHETVTPRTLSQGDLDSMYLEVQDLLDANTPSEDIRVAVSSMLEAVGQSPLAENETQRTMALDVDGEIVDQTVVVGIDDFGTFVRSIRETGIDGFMDIEASSEGEAPAARVEADLADVALQSAINEGVSESRLGALPEKAESPESPDKEAESAESQQERASVLYDSFGQLTDEFRKSLELLERSQQPQEVEYHLNLLMPLIYNVMDRFPSDITDSEVRRNLDTVGYIMGDVQYRTGRLRQILDEQGLESGEFASSVRSIQHDGLLGSMIETQRRLGNS